MWSHGIWSWLQNACCWWSWARWLIPHISQHFKDVNSRLAKLFYINVVARSSEPIRLTLCWVKVWRRVIMCTCRLVWTLMYAGHVESKCGCSSAVRADACLLVVRLPQILSNLIRPTFFDSVRCIRARMKFVHQSLIQSRINFIFGCNAALACI